MYPTWRVDPHAMKPLSQHKKQSRRLVHGPRQLLKKYDFGAGRRADQANWRALRSVGDAANQRLCDAQAQDARPAPDVVTFNEVTSRPPHQTASTPVRFGDARVMVLLAAILGFVHCLVGFTNAQLVERARPLLEDLSYSSRQAT